MITDQPSPLPPSPPLPPLLSLPALRGVVILVAPLVPFEACGSIPFAYTALLNLWLCTIPPPPSLSFPFDKPYQEISVAGARDGKALRERKVPLLTFYSISLIDGTNLRQALVPSRSSPSLLCCTYAGTWSHPCRRLQSQGHGEGVKRPEGTVQVIGHPFQTSIEWIALKRFIVAREAQIPLALHC